ncbi:Lycopene beta-cyclase [Lindgomyces ingoldianus]|uniref:Lycopene beta-cyclase n=1 Tax=Lindgomyces ingoldianus TaxID=673940 RepID=A0ACB6RCZ4_9PLEO|nr:Lycopene beta-cyclase [Lindgomyces ingoldianus]KAF2477199.1 Lycopene beta-cyclase [Lindgomyces ingoldianus]
MGFEYALVHVKYTIPPAILLTLLYRPLFARLDAYKIGFLITIAVISTIPWDSYLIRNRIWSYPAHVIIGLKLFDIPVEEIFFFVIQTYNTSLLYLICSRPTFQPVYLRFERSAAHPLGSVNPQWRYYKLCGQLAFAIIIKLGLGMVGGGGESTYLGLIIIWAVPFLLLLWSLAYQFLLGLPILNTAIPILLPTLYLWVIDTLALKRGTWVISDGTKYGFHLWDGLEIEEALFFFATNSLIVFGQVAFDNALSILYTFPHLFPNPPVLPSPTLLVRALLKPASEYDEHRIMGLHDAVHRLRIKSRSFYLASSTFQGQVRTDLLLLYSFCRVADDLVDCAYSEAEAASWVTRLRDFLKASYRDENSLGSMKDYVLLNFPPNAQSALLQVPFPKLSRQLLEELLDGFDMDLSFANPVFAHPIKIEADLQMYARRVAGTVAQMCLELIFFNYRSTLSVEEQRHVLDAGNRMGIALQHVNIARDISVDAKMARVYIPETWIKDEGLTYNSVLKNPQGARVERLRARLLDRAFEMYEGARNAIEDLPVEARGPIRVAVESYMEIGRVLRQDGYVVKAGRATVPKLRRVKVAWRALNGTAA